MKLEIYFFKREKLISILELIPKIKLNSLVETPPPFATTFSTIIQL
jgi:hypothetical protein